jgi:hypothetical protein
MAYCVIGKGCAWRLDGCCWYMFAASFSPELVCKLLVETQYSSGYSNTAQCTSEYLRVLAKSTLPPLLTHSFLVQSSFAYGCRSNNSIWLLDNRHVAMEAEWVE